MSSEASGVAGLPGAARGGRVRASPDAVLAHLAGLAAVVVAPGDARSAVIGSAALAAAAPRTVKLVRGRAIRRLDSRLMSVCIPKTTCF